MLMKIGIIGAMDIEIVNLLDRMIISKSEEAAGMKFYVGKIGKINTVIVRSGIGKVNAATCTQIMIDRFKVTHIINTGIAGSLDARIDIGDVVVSTDAVYHDFSVGIFGYPHGQVPGHNGLGFTADPDLRKRIIDAIRAFAPEIGVHEGRIASGDQFISSGEKKEWIRETFGALCTEMEGCAVAHTAERNNVPFVIVRYISDKADDSATMDYEAFEKQAAHNSAGILFSVIHSFE